MCHLDNDVDKAATLTHTLDHTLDRAARIGASTKTQMGMMQVGAAVLIAVFLFAGSVLAITTGGVLADARTGYNAGLAGIIVAFVMVVSWGALRGHGMILVVLGALVPAVRELLTEIHELRAAVRELRAEVTEITTRQERETDALNELFVQAADQVAQRRRSGG